MRKSESLLISLQHGQKLVNSQGFIIFAYEGDENVLIKERDYITSRIGETSLGIVPHEGAVKLIINSGFKDWTISGPTTTARDFLKKNGYADTEHNLYVLTQFLGDDTTVDYSQFPDAEMVEVDEIADFQEYMDAREPDELGPCCELCGKPLEVSEIDKAEGIAWLSCPGYMAGDDKHTSYSVPLTNEVESKFVGE